MFTNRYIKIPIRIYDSQEEEQTGKHLAECRSINIQARIDPTCIESYYPCIPGNEAFEKDNMTGVYISLRSGRTYISRMSITEFEQLLNEKKE